MYYDSIPAGKGGMVPPEFVESLNFLNIVEIKTYLVLSACPSLTSYPSYETLSHFLSYGPSRIRAAVQRLYKLGFLNKSDYGTLETLDKVQRN